MDIANWFQILDEAVGISYCPNTLKYDTNYFPSYHGETGGKIGLFNLGIASNFGEGKLQIQTC